MTSGFNPIPVHRTIRFEPREVPEVPEKVKPGEIYREAGGFIKETETDTSKLKVIQNYVGILKEIASGEGATEKHLVLGVNEQLVECFSPTILTGHGDLRTSHVVAIVKERIHIYVNELLGRKTEEYSLDYLFSYLKRSDGRRNIDEIASDLKENVPKPSIDIKDKEQYLDLLPFMTRDQRKATLKALGITDYIPDFTKYTKNEILILFPQYFLEEIAKHPEMITELLKQDKFNWVDLADYCMHAKCVPKLVGALSAYGKHLDAQAAIDPVARDMFVKSVGELSRYVNIDLKEIVSKKLKEYVDLDAKAAHLEQVASAFIVPEDKYRGWWDTLCLKVSVCFNRLFFRDYLEKTIAEVKEDFLKIAGDKSDVAVRTYAILVAAGATFDDSFSQKADYDLAAATHIQKMKQQAESLDRDNWWSFTPILGIRFFASIKKPE